MLASPPVTSREREREGETTILADQSLSVFLCLCSPAGVLGIRLFMPGLVEEVGGTGVETGAGDNRNIRLSIIMKLPGQARPAVQPGPSSPHWLAGWRRLLAAPGLETNYQSIESSQSSQCQPRAQSLQQKGLIAPVTGQATCCPPE